MLSIVQEVACDLDLPRLVVAHLRDAVRVERVDRRTRVGEQDGSMRRDDERTALLDEVVNADEERELPRGGERGLRLVEDVETVGLEAMLHQRQERLAMRLLVKGAVAVATHTEPLDLGCDVEEALRPRKKPLLNRWIRACRMQRWRGDSERLVANEKLTVPPSALKPAATAIAMVDFPEPFSPTRYVTGANGSPSSARTAGNENG